MLEGFRTVLPNGGDIVVSQEAATYRPEMEWIAARLNQKDARILRESSCSCGRSPRFRSQARNIGVTAPSYSWRVVSAENYQPQDGRAVYRFFELFDLPNIPGSRRHWAQMQKAESRYTTNQTIPGRENVVRAFLASAASRILATRIGRQVFYQAAGSDPLLMAAGPDAVAATRGDSRLEIHDWHEAASSVKKIETFY